MPDSAIFLLLSFLFLGSPPVQDEAPAIRVLVLTGSSDLPYHDWRVTTPFLTKILTDTGRFQVNTVEDVRKTGAQTLANSDVLVLNYNGPRWGREAERAIETFVRSGGGLVAVHGISYGEFFGMEQKDGRWTGTSDSGWPAYADMVGATWKPENIGHSRRHVFSVKWTEPAHPIAYGLEPAFQADDELYHKMDLKPGVVVLATAWSDPAKGGTGRDEPQIWTVGFGRGRCVHITLGHDLKAMAQPGFLAALARSTEWAATGKVR